MLPIGYDPMNYGGIIWWNENDEEMRFIWGTQADYDNHIKQGGTWKEYEEQARKRMAIFNKMQPSHTKQYTHKRKTR